MAERFSSQAVEVALDVLKSINCASTAHSLRTEWEKVTGYDAGHSPPKRRLIDYQSEYKEAVQQKYGKVEPYEASPWEEHGLSSSYIRLHLQTKGGAGDLAGRRRQLVRQRTTDRDCEDLETLLDSGRPQVLALLGPAGMGKSYTAKKVMLDWAAPGKHFSAFDYIFLLDCQKLSRRAQDASLAQLVCEECAALRPVLQSVFESRGLLQKRLLSSGQHYSLLVTIRPAIADQLKKCARVDQWVEILGFSEENLQEYFQHQGLAAQACEEVRSNESLLSLCAVPLTCWVVCTLLKQQGEGGEGLLGAPTYSITCVFISYIYIILKHHHSSSSPEEAAGALRSLSRLAKDGLARRKREFDVKDVEAEFGGVHRVPTSFLNKCGYRCGVRRVEVYSFTHPALQEVLAALFYASDASTGPLNGFLSASLQPGHAHQRDMVQYLFGLCHPHNWALLAPFHLASSASLTPRLKNWMKEAVTFTNRNPEDTYFLLDLLLCLYEFQEEAFTTQTVGALQEVRLQCVFLKKRDFLALRYCLQHCQASQLPHLLLHFCNLRSKEAKKLLPLLDKTKEFSIQMSELSQESMSYLSKEIATKHKLRDVWLRMAQDSDALDLTCSTWKSCNNSLRIEGVPRAQTCLRWFLQDCGFGLRELYFHDQKEEEEVQGMLEVLQETDCQLQCVSVKRCCLSERSVRALLALLESRPAITTLDLEGSRLGQEQQKLFLDELGAMGGAGLQSLGLLDTGLTAASVPAVCSLLRKTAVSALSLGDNPLGDEGVRLLSEALGDPSCQLQRLSLARCGLTESSLPGLKMALENNQTLKDIQLCGNYTSRDAGIELESFWNRRPYQRGEASQRSNRCVIL
ncbi:NACHT, LRR and PYD domains-containing protein 12-like isoform X2 [Lepisosteus oculatus]|uniref:NACHT, LRR and PYD domains-containing protein 12-like isoform X2 n=1 Tax=Lepisosteus oculatus TaxID=7918 RepID=UPI0035F50184